MTDASATGLGGSTGIGIPLSRLVWIEPSLLGAAAPSPPTTGELAASNVPPAPPPPCCPPPAAPPGPPPAPPPGSPLASSGSELPQAGAPSASATLTASLPNAARAAG